SAFSANEAIPLRYTDYGQKISPSLAWSHGPAGTKSFAIIVDDPDAKPKLVNHWSIFNIPADVTELPEGMPGDPRLMQPKDAAQGTNTHGSVGYAGPHPPPGDPAHHYHFQVFALDAPLELPVAPQRAAILRAMQGHVLGAGELVGEFARSLETESTVDAAKDLH